MAGAPAVGELWTRHSFSEHTGLAKDSLALLKQDALRKVILKCGVDPSMLQKPAFKASGKGAKLWNVSNLCSSLLRLLA